MSISSALNNAFSGLTAASRSAEVVSSNLANALTEGFARREIGLSSVTLNGFGSGVRITGVERATDRIATAARREAGTARSDAGVRQEATSRIAAAVGDPSQAGALSQKIVAFEAAIVASANDPANQTGLDTAVRRAGDVASHLRDVSGELAQIRTDADSAIGDKVATLNAALIEVRDLNVEIRRRVNGSGDINGLLDQRGKVIDRISEIVPVTVVDREFQQVALFTPAGGVLLDSSNSVGQFGFTTTPFVGHAMTIGAPLSGLDLNGTPVAIGGGSGFFDGGSLGALFDLRDTDVPAVNAQMDALARDLIERFQDPAVDTSLAVGDAGLFTDAGAAFAPAAELGLAGRIAVNAAVDPAAGGASWRLRDGINAAVQGNVGQNAILRNMEAALSQARTPGAAMGVASSMGASGFFGTITAQVAEASGRHEELAAFADTEFAVMREMESARIGVDSDEQLQRLLEIERLYAANAQVMRAVDDMLDELMRIRR